MVEARQDGDDGVVATVDRDKAKPKERLRKLIDERDRDRRDSSKTPLPVALGEAAPHAEAWLLDDVKAVRTALGLDSDHDVPNVRDCTSPKKALNELCDAAGVDPMDALSRIAEELQESRCNHRRETGLEDFLADVLREFGDS